MIGVAEDVPTDVFTDGVSELGLCTTNGHVVSAVRARLSCKLLDKFDYGKLKDDDASTITSLAAVVLQRADKSVVLAAADDDEHESATAPRFVDYLNSKDAILPFDLCVRPHLPDTLPCSSYAKACVVIDLFARVEDAVNKVYFCAWELSPGRAGFSSRFPSPLR